MKDRKIGFFRINRGFIEDNSEAVKKIMGQCVILRAEMKMEFDAVEYMAICPQFELLQEGYIAPFYEWECGLRKLEFGSRMEMSCRVRKGL